jgi:hypothetical protein
MILILFFKMNVELLYTYKNSASCLTFLGKEKITWTYLKNSHLQRSNFLSSFHWGELSKNTYYQNLSICQPALHVILITSIKKKRKHSSLFYIEIPIFTRRKCATGKWKTKLSSFLFLFQALLMGEIPISRFSCDKV